MCLSVKNRKIINNRLARIALICQGNVPKGNQKRKFGTADCKGIGKWDEQLSMGANEANSKWNKWNGQQAARNA